MNKWTSLQSLRFLILFGVTGIIMTALVAYVERSTLSTYQKNLPYLKLGDNIKNRTTKAHLWFEERLAGDQDIDFERDVLKLFEESKNILQGVYDGKTTQLGSFEKPDEQTKELLKYAIIEMEDLIAITNKRWNAYRSGESSGENAGGSLDAQFDETFGNVQRNMDDLVMHFDGYVDADAQYLNVLSWISIVLVGTIFGVIAAIVFRVQYRNERLANENLKKLEEESNRMEALTSFVEGVSQGNFDVQLEHDDRDALTNRLIDMRNALKQNAENDRRTNWATSGLAKIGEILRNSSGNIEQLYDEVVKFVVSYTHSNQGGLFLISDQEEGNTEDRTLELMSCYAFERKKFLTRKIDVGQGMVGQCFQEGLRIHLTEVPDEYVNITSGLGGSTPRAILLVPLKVSEEVYGVIELASFKKYEEHEVELIERFAESIASTISSVRTNESTKMLLARTQQQAEEMRSQEEEMRQNMEELSATQEEMGRKEREYVNRIRELEDQVSSKTL